MSHYLSLLLFLPLAGVLLLLCVPARLDQVIRILGNLVAVAGFLAAVPLWFWYDPQNAAFQLIERAAWIPPIGAQYLLGVDGFSVLLILLTTLIGCLATLSSWRATTGRAKEYYVLLLIVQTGLLGAFMALDFLLFFVFWQLALVPMGFLIGIWGGANRRGSRLKFLRYTAVGSAMTLLGVLAVYFVNHSVTGVYTFDVTELHKLQMSFGLQCWVFAAFFLGLAIAVPLVPFHSWLPDVHTDAPTAGSVLLAAVMLKMGIYGLLRFSLPILPDATRSLVPYLALLSIAGILYGALAAMAQKEWKRLVAYTSLSQMGMVMLGILALNDSGIAGSMLQQINHGLSTGALFLLVGMIDERRRTMDTQASGGFARVMPIFAALFLVMTLASIGLPALNGFISQRLLLQGLFVAHKWWAVVAIGGIVLTAAALLSLYMRTMFGGARRTESAPITDLTIREIGVVAPLLALVIWIGVHPKPFLDRLKISAHHVVSHVNPGEGNAAECDTIPTPEQLSSAPGSQFLMALPCGPDGQPLAEPASEVPR